MIKQMKINTYLAHMKTLRYQIKVSETITSISISNIDNGFCLIFVLHLQSEEYSNTTLSCKHGEI